MLVEMLKVTGGNGGSGAYGAHRFMEMLQLVGSATGLIQAVEAEAVYNASSPVSEAW
jgi:hypothetical protein